MVNFEFADNGQLRFGETNQLPITKNNSQLYFMVVDQDSMNIASYNCDVRGLNNLHRCLSQLEDGIDSVLILANWKGQYQAHSFVCEKDLLLERIVVELGDSYTDELCSGLAA
ncbi:hypothetical protein [Photobacterium damselae]|uniref:hypothetical protein n=1 Tax=Photobacterium damselae TaxID=38293 RepID=UPI001F40C4ED|nr:hypothetical protein [Photobacterium damselae]UKA05045.1 hypothetical protein IHC89_22625 [Photobacterium damselae subsp. damselae]